MSAAGFAPDWPLPPGVRAWQTLRTGGGFCTFADAQRFFSHRREAPCGRMATMIWIEAGRPGVSAGPLTSDPGIPIY